MATRVFLVNIFFTVSIVTSAQSSYMISKPELSLKNNLLTINYDITGCGSGEFVDISLILINSKGDTLAPMIKA